MCLVNMSTSGRLVRDEEEKEQEEKQEEEEQEQKGEGEEQEEVEPTARQTLSRTPGGTQEKGSPIRGFSCT